MNIMIVLRIALFLILAPAARAELVLAVKDGDTIVVQTADGPDTVRLQGIDAPELKQPYGQAAKKRLTALILGRDVRLEPEKRRDRYRRIVARVYLGDAWINRQLVAEGLAKRYPRYDRKHHYQTAETIARLFRRGLWRRT